MRPDTPADHIAEAERLLRTAAQYPEDREPLLLQAAAHLELAGDRARATALYDELLAADAAEHPHLIKALKAANLWEYGHEAEARAIIEGIRAAAPARTRPPGRSSAETLESHDELESAHDFFPTALTLLLAPGEEVPYATQSLLIGRHRVRRLMGARPRRPGTTCRHAPHRHGPAGRTPRPEAAVVPRLVRPGANSRPRSPASAPNWAPTAPRSPARSRWRSCTGRSPN